MATMRNRLIKEDVGFFDGSTYSTLRKKGAKAKASPNVVFRMPTPKEIQEGQAQSADIPLAKITVYSKVLYDFGLVSKVHKSKVYRPSDLVSEEKLDKGLKSFKDYIGKFDESEPASNSRDVLVLTRDDVFSDIDFVSVIREVVDLDSEEDIKKKLAEIYDSLVEYKSPDGKPDNKERSARIKKIVGVCGNLMRVIKNETAAGHSKEEIEKIIKSGNRFDDFISSYMPASVNEILDDTTNETISDLEANFQSYVSDYKNDLKSKDRPKQYYSTNLIHEEAMEGLQRIADANNGVLTTETFFDYLRKNNPEALETVSENYDIPVDDLNSVTFPNWESLAEFFYSPENIQRIFEMCSVKQRKTVEGGARLGITGTDQIRQLINKASAREKKLENLANVDEIEEKIRKMEENLEVFRIEKEKVERDLKNAKDSENEDMIRDLQKAFDNANNVYMDCQKNVNDLKDMRDLLANPRVRRENRDNIKNEIKAIYVEIAKSVETLKNQLSGTAGVEELNAALKKIRSDLTVDEIKKRGGVDGGDDTYILNFMVNTKNKRVVDYIFKKLIYLTDSVKKELDNHQFEYTVDYDDMSTTHQVVTEFYILYNGRSALYSMFKKNPAFSKQVVNSIISAIPSDLKVQGVRLIPYFDDNGEEVYVKYNELFEHHPYVRTM